MTARILDGRAVAADIRADLKQRVAALAARGVVPGLGTILVGDDPGSHAYVNGKHRDSAQVGITSIRRDLPADATQEQVEGAVGELNADPACTGYLVQLPLPAQPSVATITPAAALHPAIANRLPKTNSQLRMVRSNSDLLNQK